METTNQAQEYAIINYITYLCLFLKIIRKETLSKSSWNIKWLAMFWKGNEEKLTFIEFLNTFALTITIKPIITSGYNMGGSVAL